MCGLAGLFDCFDRAIVDRRLLRRMTDALVHRGPDGNGFYIAPGIGLGHRRLSIIDLEGGDQPLFNEDRSVCVVFNGEIYNFKQLMTQLIELGHVFRTRCDTEVIVHAWEEWGKACLDRFNGMFAFALWDERREILFLARDRLGEKPLYYSFRSDGTLLFASELKSLLCDPLIPGELDPFAIEEFFAYGYIPDPRTIYKNVHKLPPAHYLLVRRGAEPGPPREYWNLRFDPISNSIRQADAEEELIARMRQAVAIRTVADVPLGAFLSGGVDSSAVVAMMASLQATPIRTFSISFDQKGFDESQFAMLVAKRYETDHHGREVSPDSFELLHKLATVYDEPFGDSSAMPTLRLCAAARENVTVALSGDGGDELFAGYRRYRWHCFQERFRSTLPSGLRSPLFGCLAGIYPKLDWAPRPLRAKAILHELSRDAPDAYFSSVSICDDTLRKRLFSDSLLRKLDGYDASEVLKRHINRCDSDDPLAQIQYADFKTYLPGDILTKVDRASMAHSLEVRIPLLDHTLVEWSTKLPARFKLRNGRGKYLLKEAVRGYVPNEILSRPKQGFVVPIATWFRGPLKDRVWDVVGGPILEECGLFKIETIELLLKEHQSGKSDHSAPLWLLSVMGAFLAKRSNVESKLYSESVRS